MSTREDDLPGPPAGDELWALEAAGLCDETMSAELPEPPTRPVEVRPAAEEDSGWTARAEEALALRPGTSVGVAAEDPFLAASVAVRLAVSAADRGQRTVVIDGSVTTPSIAKALEGDGDEGLVDSVLFGVTTAVTARRTLAPGVSLMTSGSSPVAPAEVFRSANLGPTLRSFAPDVLVIVALPGEHLADASPSLAALLAVGRTPEEIRRLVESAADARPPRVVGLLARRPPVPPPAVAESPTVAVSARRQGAPAPEGPQVRTALRAEPPRPRPPVAAARRGTPARRRWPAWTLALVAIAVALGSAWHLGYVGPLEKPLATRPAAPTSTTAAPAESIASTTAADTTTAGSPVSPEAAPYSPPPRPVVPDTTAHGVPTTEKPGGPSSATLMSGPGGPYIAYASSHGTERAAAEDAAALTALGVSGAVAVVDVPGIGIRYRVRVEGGYPTLAAARDAIATLKQLGYDGAWIERTSASR